MTLSLTKPRLASGPYLLDRGDHQLLATPEQTVIVDAAVKGTDNLIINALAGAAKTSTLEFICRYLPSSPILSLAFNKKIAEEMSKRLPPHVTCRTMNSIGHRVWGAATGKRLSLDTKKSYTIVKSIVDDLKGTDRSDAYDAFGEILRTLRYAKQRGYIPSASHFGKPLCSPESFYASLEEVPSSLFVSIVEEALTRSITASYAGAIDFDDQIYMPTLFGGGFPKFPLVMVDEAQDLSEINHVMLAKLITTRLIAVGDPFQSIYAFRGAKVSGMVALEREHRCHSLPLSVSFRCPQAIVEYVRWRAPHMQWRKPGGQVHILDHLVASDIPDGAAIICRNNAPLFDLALRLLTHGRGVHLIGTDLGPALIKILKKLCAETATQESALAAIEDWKAERLTKSRNPESVEDRAECLRVFVRFGSTLGGAIAYAEHIFSARGTIQLLSGHKAKGLEWQTVYHLDPWRIPSRFAEGPEAIEQEDNLRYVISTRAKENLFEIDADRIVMEDEE